MEMYEYENDEEMMKIHIDFYTNKEQREKSKKKANGRGNQMIL